MHTGAREAVVVPTAVSCCRHVVSTTVVVVSTKGGGRRVCEVAACVTNDAIMRPYHGSQLRIPDAGCLALLMIEGGGV